MTARHPRRARESALIAEAVREIGILLIAFAPLDAVFAPAEGSRSAGLFFALLGLVLFVIGLKLERSNAG